MSKVYSCSVYFRNVWCELAKSTSCQKDNPKGLNGSVFSPYSAMLVEFVMQMVGQLQFDKHVLKWVAQPPAQALATSRPCFSKPVLQISLSPCYHRKQVTNQDTTI